MKRQNRILSNDDRIILHNDRIKSDNGRIPAKHRDRQPNKRKKISSISSMKEIFD
ncbi:hypothetical protein P343_14800 [Sporolactobacillus laevolacticus DSM 442]|uniref:Uncharacterized protein n=1 Tax=Sporolactobacillus laevolacticus DSM 442 TaxID=1395513 RepID=V6IUT7_9BACL|nr:hypothetical protein P343_14800 [Sporolactobacillus laevolacticus DSM 442]